MPVLADPPDQFFDRLKWTDGAGAPDASTTRPLIVNVRPVRMRIWISPTSDPSTLTNDAPASSSADG
jgi:hypothetical protein